MGLAVPVALRDPADRVLAAGPADLLQARKGQVDPRLLLRVKARTKEHLHHLQAVEDRVDLLLVDQDTVAQEDLVVENSIRQPWTLSEKR